MIIGCSPRKVYTGPEYPKVLSDQTEKWRPAFGGISIGPAWRRLAGTLGSIVFDAQTRQKLFLSNWHVIALSNYTELGAPILQPANVDGGRYPDDLFGTLERFAYVNRPEEGRNLVDAAVGRPRDPGDIYNFVNEVGFVNGYADPEIGMDVVLSSRDGVEHGKITDVGATFKVSGYPWGSSVFEDQFVMSPGIEKDGDSGGAIVDEATGAVVGLAFAGTHGISLANKASNVARILGVTWS